MQLVREDRLGSPGYVWVASTLGGNPISATAALAALEVLRGDGVYPRLHKLGEYLREGMRGVLAAHRIEAQVIGDGPLAQVVFGSQRVRDYRSTQAGEGRLKRAMMLALFRRGVFLNPMGTKLYLSLAHDEAVCDAFLERFDASLAEIS
jgi:glutamate-1-semialdehyde 2,1-aminomutase